ncbi:MAG: hypothetical protein HY791_10550 [Deltaproteobacteria bacterium]|nr:hypothetical protein [Deltaproteobacteria bacterium]
MAEQPSRDKADRLKLPNPDKPRDDTSTDAAAEGGDKKKVAPVVRLPGMVGPMEPKMMGPSPAGLLLVVLLLVGLAGGWVIGKLKLHDRRSAVALATGKLPEQLRLIESRNGGLTKQDIETALSTLAQEAGAQLDGPVEIVAERITFVAERQGIGDDAAKFCKVKDMPQSFREVPIPEQTRFQVLMSRCAMARWVVTYKAKVPIQFFAFKDVYEPARAILVSRYADDGEFEEEEEEDEAPEPHRGEEPTGTE